MRRSAAVLVIALLGPITVVAQQAPAPIGSRIRATPRAPYHRSITGTLVAQSGDTIVIHVLRSDTARVALSALELVEVSAGPRTHFWKGAGYGFLIGAAGGAAAGAAAIDADWRAVGALLGAGLGGLGGLLVGGGIGSNVSSEYWKPAPGWELSLVLPATRPGLGISVRF